MAITDYPTSTTTSNGYINVTAAKERYMGFLQSRKRIKIKKASKEKVRLIGSKKKNPKTGINYVLWTANEAVGLLV